MANTQSGSAAAQPVGGKLGGKDFINIGIFTALYFIVVFIVACLGFVPILMALICAIIPLIAGIPYMLFVTKIHKFGMITIMGLLIGILMFVTGMGYFSIGTGLVCGFLADCILKAGKWASAKMSVLSHGVFSCWLVGNFLPFLLTADTYLDQVRSSFGDAYVTELMTYLQPWVSAHARGCLRHRPYWRVDRA